MIPRGRLDISFRSLLKGIGFCIADVLGFREPVQLHDDAVACFSVRTGLDLTLRVLDLPLGSEILMTNINIPDMFSIVNTHGLVIVPLEVNKHTLAISKAQVEASITSNTKAILITHLFGGIMDMDEVLKLAKIHRLLVIEDCAQAYDGNYRGHPLSDVVMFSFGLIKTNTSLTGATLYVPDPELLEKIKAVNEQLPMQDTALYLKKHFKAIAIQLLTLRFFYKLLYYFSKITNKELDDILAGFTRGFPGDDVMRKIAFRPCHSNLRMMQMRARAFSIRQIIKRKNIAEHIMKLMPDGMSIGQHCERHSQWVLPLEHVNPEALIKLLRQKGIDATARASSLIKIGDSGKGSEKADRDNEQLNLNTLVYLPIVHDVISRVRTEDYYNPMFEADGKASE